MGNMDTKEANLSFEYIKVLQEINPAVKLLNAENLPLIASFLHQAFILPNQRTIAAETLITQLDDYLYYLRQTYDESLYPQSAKAYLNEWAESHSGYLRKYYTRGSDEPAFDLTPATEKALEWLQSLQQKSFVGTESRLLIITQILRDVATQTETDPKTRIATLKRQKKEINEEIAAIQRGAISTYSATQIRERFIEAEDTAKKLLSDFRQVEQNFRELDQQTREKIALSIKNRGGILSEVFEDHDAIRESDQGQSFLAFWEFLMTPERQKELNALLEQMYQHEAVQTLNPSDFLKRIQYALSEAGEGVYKTNTELAEQLRRYLDDQAYLENKRLMALIKKIEKHSIKIKQQKAQPSTDTLSLPRLKADIDLFMTRSLFSIPQNPVITDTPDELTDSDIDFSALFEQVYIDEALLKKYIALTLQEQQQASLEEIIRRFPVEKGMAELATYLKIAYNSDHASFIDNESEHLWVNTTNGFSKQICVPKIIFVAQQIKES